MFLKQNQVWMIKRKVIIKDTLWWTPLLGLGVESAVPQTEQVNGNPQTVLWTWPYRIALKI